MHGLINRSIQCFVRDSYGDAVWADACRKAELGFDNFEAMLNYDDAVTERVLSAVCSGLDRSRPGLMEDLGTYLVSHPNLERVRRLLRFGGDSFEEFLHSLDDLPDRSKLALPELDFPDLELRETAPGTFDLIYRWNKAGFGPVAVGILRAMADDYGALVFLDHKGQTVDGCEEVTISINLLAAEFAQGREFLLGGTN